MAIRSRLLLALFAFLALASPASAVSLFLDNGGSATLGPGDTFDQVILTDTAHVEINTGAIIGELVLLNEATALVTGGDVGGPVKVFDLAVLTFVVQPLPTPFLLNGADSPGVITATECPACALIGVLGDSTPVVALGLVNTLGEIRIQAVPEPSPLAMMGLGLIGLAIASPRRR